MIGVVSRGLALAFLAGPWEREALIARGSEAIGAPAKWLPAVVEHALRAFPATPVDGVQRVAAILRDSKAFRAAVFSLEQPARIKRWFIPAAVMVPVTGAPATFATLPLAAPGDLARALRLTPSELDWFADTRRLNVHSTTAALSHYRFVWVPKAAGGYRLLEAPKPRLRAIQRWLLDHVLAAVPPSPCAHGFVAGRDVRSFAQPHARQAVVVRLDLQDFFPSVSRARVAALFQRVGYPRAVSRLLAALCTVAAPAHVLDAHPRERVDLARRFLANVRLRDPHLPQGAPTSPALSNLAAWRLDRRLSALAAGFGAVMTRYADDLAFSGGDSFSRALRFFLPRAGAIALEEGFAVNHRKTRVMRCGRRQQLCGLIVNEAPNVDRRERDRLRAVLFNVARFGAESQNRDAHPDFVRHLQGKVAWVASVNAAAGTKLKAMLDRASAVRGAPSL